MHALCFLAPLLSVGCMDTPAPPDDAPLGTTIYLSAIHYAEGKDQPRQLVIRGKLGGDGQLELDPNHLQLGPDGTIRFRTTLAGIPIPARIKSVDSPDPARNGRKVYEIVPAAGTLKRTYSLVLSPTEGGPHHLLIREGEKDLGTYPLVDPDRKAHLDLAPQLTRATAEEQKAVAALRKVAGYSFRFRLESNNAVTFLYFPNVAGEIGTLDPGLQGLKNLTHLIFKGGRLGPDGLASVRHMASLKALDFTDADIDNAGLACVKDSTQLARMSFFGSRGLSDDGLAHLRGLVNLTGLDLRNETFTADAPKAPRVTDAGLKHLAGLTKLEYLNLQGQHITDDGLRHLGGMADLQLLSLSFRGITDAGLKHLERHRNLRSLHLYGTGVTSQGRAALKAKVPLFDW